MRILFTLLVIALLSSSQVVVAQQRDGVAETTTPSGSSSTSSGRVNFDIIQLMNGEYLEMFGSGTTRGLLGGNSTGPGIVLGSTSADPLIFFTNSTERMRILSNGFIGIGTPVPINPLEIFHPDPRVYTPATTAFARIRLVNSDPTNNNVFEINFSAADTNGGISTGVRLAAVFTNHTPGQGTADFVVGGRHLGAFGEWARFTSTGNVGIGTPAPTHKLDVAGAIRSRTGGFVFPDGSVQTTASTSSQWTTSGANLYYNSGNVGVGVTTPAAALHVVDGRAIRVGNAYFSSGGDYVHLSNHTWFNGGAWQSTGQPGALYQIVGQQHMWHTHNGASAFTPLMSLTPTGNLGIGTYSPSGKLHVNGGTIRLASILDEVPFQLYSHANSDSLWLTSANAAKSEIHLSTGYAVNYDRSVAVQYLPGTTGGAGGILNIGQMAKNVATFTHGTTALYTNGAERVRINSAGNVGIGTLNPTHKLDVAGPIRSSSGGYVFPDGSVQTTAAAGGVDSQWTTSGSNIYYTAGNVGIGYTDPQAKIHASGVGIWGTAVFGGSTFNSHFNYNGDNSEDTYIRGGKTPSRVVINDQNTGSVIVALGGGNVGIGTGSPASKLHVNGDGRVTGNLTVDGNIAAKYQDLAEWVPAAEQLAAGTVVVLDSTKPNQVTSSSSGYDTRVAGVISAQPGIVLGEKSDNKVLVATTGRVRVKVDATNGPIQIGDLLVTSDRAGFAMKSMPVEIGSSRIHRPGTLIGKALEPLARGTGEILVLLSLQ
jgi:hypothetical protein